jgi:hypothetical protein
MNRKVGDKFVRSWTKYALFAKAGKTGHDDFRYRMLVCHGETTPAAPEGFTFIGVYGGYCIEEAWQMFYKVQGLKAFVVDQPAGDPARGEPQPSLL